MRPFFGYFIAISFSISTGAGPLQNCSINGSIYTSDRQVIRSFPFHVFINPTEPQLLPPNSNLAKVDTDARVIELMLFNIDTVPPALFCLSQLQVLSIFHSTQLTISPEILRLASSLKSFTVSDTAQSLILPPALFKMTALSTLSIVNCGLETISEDIIQLTQLTQLILDQNQLITLPSTLGHMPLLTYLSVNGNPRLSSLDVLSGLTSLITLQASNCLISHLPTNISNVRTIEMNGNQLTSLDGIEIIASASSDSFSFANNEIASISFSSLAFIQSLSYFDLSSNRLTMLPDSIYRIKDLQTLNIQHNYFDQKEIEWIQGIFGLTNTTVIV